ncbi:unnamed protein product [Vitrella brassicaformis CCMP3155]|uniref:Uncharacterized protein n=1 Tax=Vitrella brassicaformis (strain CCMP3155) TaxID=1169540 RepID=A0A0G4GHF4_VITBC|nr:unnamed protein product [Vitrella brassicaformis CCMP3155]|eukprot:CEM29151.1 unnamed protein product [Vitrella brassicaformis CCMP3155]
MSCRRHQRELKEEAPTRPPCGGKKKRVKEATAAASYSIVQHHKDKMDVLAFFMGVSMFFYLLFGFIEYTGSFFLETVQLNPHIPLDEHLQVIRR